jgi:hypothetical protein
MTHHPTIFKQTRAYFKQSGLPSSDHEVAEGFKHEFSAGGHYGIELSSMNNLKVLTKTFQLAKQYNIKIHRAIECRGIVRLPDNEIREMASLCESENAGLILSIGPRAISDIGGFVHSPNGKRIGYRLRGVENVIHAVEDVKRAIDLGVRGFLIYDEGLLFLLDQMRNEGALPKNIMFKFSVHGGCANPLSAKLLAQHGADTINIVPDLEVGMITAFRKVIKEPLDIFSDTAKEAGGLLRTYDIPEIIYYASPVYLKCGPISQQFQNHLPSETELEERVKQTKCVVEHIERYLPEAKLVNKKEVTLSLPNTKLITKKLSINSIISHISRGEAVNA